MWDKRFGGVGFDQFQSFQQSHDGGYILGGISESYMGGGDKSQFGHGSNDYWIIKIDSLGNKQWDKDFGSAQYDYLKSVLATSDGGYLISGYCDGGPNGDKTQDSWGGSTDYWIVKTDSLGNKQWDKDFGGFGFDQLSSCAQTSDGGYILGGFCTSGIGGDKTEALWGGSYGDYWIVKIDSLGNKQWDKDFGGTDRDELHCIEQTSDGGFILGGYSYSGISGNKSQANQDTSENTYDYWIVKTDSQGNLQWDKTFGGTNNDRFNSLQQTSDGGYILGGNSWSDAGGDKSQPLVGPAGDVDYWIIKIDSIGNKEWDKDFGGTGLEYGWLYDFGNVIQTSDGGFLATGNSRSLLSGDKTEYNLGTAQTWIIKIDTVGNLVWDKTILTPCYDEISMAIETQDGCYAIANADRSGCSTMGGYKSQPGRGGADYWIVKFCDGTFIPPVATASADSILCAGSCTNFMNLSFNASSYQWFFPGAIPPYTTIVSPSNICYNTPGTYDITLIASNANGSDTLTLPNFITVFPAPSQQVITQSGDTLFSLTGSASYQWYFNGNDINAATNYFYIATQSGNYSVIATDSNGCEVEAVMNNVIANERELAVGSWQLAVFPNPVTTTLDIRGLKNNSADEIKIFNVYGEKVFSAVDCPLLPIAIGTNCQLSSGMYYIEIVSDKKIFTTKFIKQ